MPKQECDFFVNYRTICHISWTTARWDGKHIVFRFGAHYTRGLTVLYLHAMFFWQLVRDHYQNLLKPCLGGAIWRHLLGHPVASDISGMQLGKCWLPDLIYGNLLMWVAQQRSKYNWEWLQFISPWRTWSPFIRRHFRTLFHKWNFWFKFEWSVFLGV